MCYFRPTHPLIFNFYYFFIFLFILSFFILFLLINFTCYYYYYIIFLYFYLLFIILFYFLFFSLLSLPFFPLPTLTHPFFSLQFPLAGYLTFFSPFSSPFIFLLSLPHRGPPILLPPPSFISLFFIWGGGVCASGGPFFLQPSISPCPSHGEPLPLSFFFPLVGPPLEEVPQFFSLFVATFSGNRKSRPILFIYLFISSSIPLFLPTTNSYFSPLPPPFSIFFFSYFF